MYAGVSRARKSRTLRLPQRGRSKERVAAMMTLYILQYSFALPPIIQWIGLDEASCPEARGARPG